VSLAIIGAGLANAIALLAIKEPFSLWNTIVGLIILCILSVYVPAPASRRSLKVAYTAIWSLSFLTTFGVVFNAIFQGLGGVFPDYGLEFTAYPKAFAVFTDSGGKITPFNVYDISFFITLFVVFVFFFLRRFGNPFSKKSNNCLKSPSPPTPTQSDSEQSQTTTKETPPVPGQLSDQGEAAPHLCVRRLSTSRQKKQQATAMQLLLFGNVGLNVGVPQLVVKSPSPPPCLMPRWSSLPSRPLSAW
jgi:hypothetical protein